MNIIFINQIVITGIIISTFCLICQGIYFILDLKLKLYIKRVFYLTNALTILISGILFLGLSSFHNIKSLKLVVPTTHQNILIIYVLIWFLINLSNLKTFTILIEKDRQ